MKHYLEQNKMCECTNSIADGVNYITKESIVMERNAATELKNENMISIIWLIGYLLNYLFT